MLTGLQRLAGKGKMGVVGRGNDDHIDIVTVDKLLRIIDNRDLRPVGVHFAGIAGGHRRQGQARRRVDQGGVKSFSGETIANDSDTKRVSYRLSSIDVDAGGSNAPSGVKFTGQQYQ